MVLYSYLHHRDQMHFPEAISSLVFSEERSIHQPMLATLPSLNELRKQCFVEALYAWEARNVLEFLAMDFDALKIDEVSNIHIRGDAVILWLSSVVGLVDG